VLNAIGNRIKNLRKEKKMTLAELAGKRLTKGMLSLIENGKANPSMDSLHYIAQQLNVDVSLLLNDGQIKEIRELLLVVEEDYSNIKDPFNPNQVDNIKQIIEKIMHVQDHLLGNNYEEIRLLDLHLRLKSFLNQAADLEEEMYSVIHLYEKIHAYNRVVNCFTFLASRAFTQKDFNKALQYVKQAEAKIEPYVHLVDHLSKLDMYYLLTILYAAVDDVPNTEKNLELAIDIAQKNKIYYRIDDFYRFMLVQVMSRNDLEKSKYYITKLKLHADFTEDILSQYSYICCETFYLNLIEKDYRRTLEIAKEAKKLQPDRYGILKSLLGYIVAEETYALWALGQYIEAINCSDNFSIPSNIHHPYDLSTLYKCFAVRALCYLEIGDREAAKREILYASNEVEGFPNTIDKLFIDEAYKKIIENK